MVAQPANELSDFYSFVTGLLAHGQQGLSPEEALQLWRGRGSATRDETLAADDVREALADMEAGDHGRPVEDIDREVRAKYFAKTRA